MENGVSNGGYPRPPFGEYPNAMAINMMPGAMVHNSHPMMSMGQYPMMAMPMPMGMPGMVLTPQMSQMYAGAAQAGPKGNIFFKTRLCNKWRSGSCPYGDKCTYAHGQHELRYVPPEVLKEFEDQQVLEQQGQGVEPGSSGSRDSPTSSQHDLLQQQQQQQQQAGAGDQGKRNYFKTRLCIKFMQTGYCTRGAACTFAHGYHDLNPSGTLSGGMPHQHMAMNMNNGRYQQYPPASVQQYGYPGMHPEALAHHQKQSGNTNNNGNMNSTTRQDKISPEVQRARGMSAIADVGNAAAAADGDCVTTALEAVDMGAAFKETVYGDAVQQD